MGYNEKVTFTIPYPKSLKGIQPKRYLRRQALDKKTERQRVLALGSYTVVKIAKDTLQIV